MHKNGSDITEGPSIGIEISSHLSAMIDICRVICIFPILYTHFPPYQGFHPVSPLSLDAVMWFFQDCIGRTSLPLLTVISGYLAVQQSRRRTWWQQAVHRFVALMVPLIIWDVIAILLNRSRFVGVTHMSVIDTVNAVTGLAGYPFVTPLYFLRDIFVCSICLPIFTLCLRRARNIVIVVLALCAAFIQLRPLFLNSSVPLFFALGCAIALDPMPFGARWEGFGHKVWLAGSALAVWGLKAAVPFATDLAWRKGVIGGMTEGLLTLTARVAGAILFWLLAEAIFRSRYAWRMRAFAPFMMFIFCAQSLIIGLIWAVARRLGMDIDSPLFPLLFFVGPLMVFIVGSAAAVAIGSVSPSLLSILMGGRNPTRQQFARIFTLLEPDKTGPAAAGRSSVP